MLVNDLALMVHQNARKHGWWEDDRSLYEIIALIHSEWSEALEEARAGRPLVWYTPVVCDNFGCWENEKCCARISGMVCYGQGSADEIRPFAICPGEHKPEGIAAELIDGVIRILDSFGKNCIELDDPETGEPAAFENLWGKNGADEMDVPDDVAELVALLHAYTSNIIIDDEHDILNLVQAMSMALIWINRQGIDPLKLLMQKHAYNVTRPYKHGKKF